MTTSTSEPNELSTSKLMQKNKFEHCKLTLQTISNIHTRVKKFNHTTESCGSYIGTSLALTTMSCNVGNINNTDLICILSTKFQHVERPSVEKYHNSTTDRQPQAETSWMAGRKHPAPQVPRPAAHPTLVFLLATSL